LINILYKIVYYIEIPTFKRDKISFYQKVIACIVDIEKNNTEKDTIVAELLKNHCKQISEIYAT